MRLVCISDTHFPFAPELIPEGDVFIHAGDHTMNGTPGTIMARFEDIARLPHKHKIVIAGNHDFGLQEDAGCINYCRSLGQADPNFHYLVHEAVEIEGVKFFGSPWVPELPQWAFTYPPQKAWPLWLNIPNDTEVLITHGPMKGVLDNDARKFGCPELRARILFLMDLQPRKLKAHIFGHIHEGYGVEDIDGVKFINASLCTYPGYKQTQMPHVVDL